jgi:hypothetical protein
MIGMDAYPRLAAYLAQLPDGLDSHPRCQAKASTLRSFLAHWRLDAPPKGTPEPLAALIRDPPQVTEWMSEAQLMALLTLIADRQGDDAAFLQGMYEANRGFLTSPWYAALMRVSTPGLLIRGVALRWGAIHRGTSLSAEAAPGGCRLHFTFPAGLYSDLMLRAYGTAFDAGIAMAGGRDIEVRVAETTPAGVTYELRWR